MTRTTAIILTIIAIVLITVGAISCTTTHYDTSSQFDVVEWVSSPANPASPVHQLLF